jgi:hypothetical protein
MPKAPPPAPSPSKSRRWRVGAPGTGRRGSWAARWPWSAAPPRCSPPPPPPRGCRCTPRRRGPGCRTAGPRPWSRRVLRCPAAPTLRAGRAWVNPEAPLAARPAMRRSLGGARSGRATASQSCGELRLLCWRDGGAAASRRTFAVDRVEAHRGARLQAELEQAGSDSGAHVAHLQPAQHQRCSVAATAAAAPGMATAGAIRQHMPTCEYVNQL